MRDGTRGKGVVAVRGVEEMMRTCILEGNVHHQVVGRQLPQWDLDME